MSGDKEENDKYSAIQKYENEWSELFSKEKITHLRQSAQHGALRASRFRSVCWRVLLDVLVEDSNEWMTQIRNTRCHYSKVKAQMTTDPRKTIINDIGDNPLSQDTKSIWYQHFCDTELRQVIKQDVDRTFPGIEFFRKDQIQNIMVDILFIYARVHPIMCYRQGMHEILAPLLFVIHCDQQAMLHTKEHGILSILIQEVLNPNHLEDDAYALFENIMNGIAFCYNIKDLEPTNTGYFPSSVKQHNGSSPNHQQENEIILRLTYIKDFILSQFDPDLCEHLQALDIAFSLFGIRWLRLLFGREFPLQDLLVLWDAIFAEGKSFDFINYIVVAMLITIRNQYPFLSLYPSNNWNSSCNLGLFLVLSSDYTYCLTHLMRYPTITDIMYIINYALYLRNPQTRNPPSFTNHVQNYPIKQNATESYPIKLSNRRSSTLPTKGKVEYDKRMQQKRVVGQRLNRMQNQSLRMTSAIPHSDSETAIIDGFTLHDPEVLRVELNHAHNVMALCQIKLAQYHKVLQRSFLEGGGNRQETQQILDGICELCHLLRSRHNMNNYSSQPPEVESALEAGESKIPSPETPTNPTPTSQVNQIVQSASTDQLPKWDIKDDKKVRNSEFYVANSFLREQELKEISNLVGALGSETPGAPLCDPLNSIKEFVMFNPHEEERERKFLLEAVRILNTDLESLRIK